jgi:Holliday junction resolvasome RuvABC endonuclease subunit
VSGWAVYDGKDLIDYGKFSATQTDIGDRLYYIRNQVLQLIDKFEIDEVVFEDIQLQDNRINNVQTFKALAEVFGVLHELFVEIKMPREAVLSSVMETTIAIPTLNKEMIDLYAQPSKNPKSININNDMKNDALSKLLDDIDKNG